MKLAKVVGGLVALIILFGVVGMFIFVRISQNPTIQTELSLEEISHVLNIESNLPKSPNELMYNVVDILTLLYSNYSISPRYIEEIIRVQRLLFSNDLLIANTLNEQYINFMSYRQYNLANGMVQSDIQIVNMEQVYPWYWVSYVSQYIENLGTLNWVYFLVYDYGWKVEAFCLADSNFIPHCI